MWNPDIHHDVEEAKTGDRQAFGRLYDLLFDRLYRFIYFRVGNRMDAEDITEQIFLSVFTNIKTYENRGFPFEAWVFRIARNQVINYYRTKKQTSPLEQAEYVPDPGASPEERTEHILTYESVMQAFPLLPDSYREMIILKFIEEYETKEISIMLEKPVSHVRVLQNRAIKKLRSILNL